MELPFDKPSTTFVEGTGQVPDALTLAQERRKAYDDPSKKPWQDPAVKPFLRPTLEELNKDVPKDSPAIAIQMGGDHYKRMGAYQPWEVLQRWLNKEQYQGYLLGTALAYLGRFNMVDERGAKGGMLDAKKAMHTLQRLTETEET
jgi:hypothetical protein